MELLGRDLSRTMIVDNSILAFGYHLSSGIPIPSFYGQPWDNELPHLINILKDLYSTIATHGRDIRGRISQLFGIEDKIKAHAL
jgi:CTD small phosphatase-like protein 2